MAVYTHLGAEDLARLMDHYDVGRLASFKGIAEGVENTNYLLQTTTGSHILTLYEKRVRAEDLPYFLGFMADAVLRLAIDRGGFGSGSDMGGKADPNSPMAQSTITEGGPAAAPGGLGADLGVDPTWLVLGALVVIGILIVVVTRARRRKRTPGQLSI